MEDNVYQTPESDLANQDSEKRSAVKAVLIAAAVDLGGSIGVGVVIGIIYGIMLAVEGTPIEEIERQMKTVDTSSMVSIVGLVLSAFVSIFAGYLCAKTVNYNEFKVVSILGLVTVSAGLLMEASYYTLNENVLMSLLTFACNFFGAWLFVRSKAIKSSN